VPATNVVSGKIYEYQASRPSSILIEHYLFVDIVKKRKKKFTDFLKIFRGFSKFNKNQILLEAYFGNFYKS